MMARGDELIFGKPAKHISTDARFQLVGSPGDRIVVLRRGAVMGWATGFIESPLRVHLVEPLGLDDPALAAFREVVGYDDDVVICRWGAP